MARDLQVDEDMAFQRREWRVQRAGWALILVLLVLAFFGLFGDGPLARRTLASPDGRLVAKVQKFDRHRSPSALVVLVRPEPGADSVRVWLSRDFAQDQNIETVHPEPESVTAGGDRMVYEFSVGGAEEQVEISFDAIPQGIGSHRVRLGLVGGPAVAFSQFVFP